MYRHVLVPTDGSRTALAAADEAFALADRVGAAEVHVVSVIDESASSLLLSDKRLSDLLESMQTEGDAAVEAAADRAPDGAGFEVVTGTVRGMTVEEALRDYVERHDVDLVVMGTRGRTGLKKLLGSTTERFLAEVDVPVLVVSERDGDD